MGQQICNPETLRQELILGARRLNGATETLQRVPQLDPRMDIYMSPIVWALRTEFTRVRMLGNQLEVLLGFSDAITQPMPIPTSPPPLEVVRLTPRIPYEER